MVSARMLVSLLLPKDSCALLVEVHRRYSWVGLLFILSIGSTMKDSPLGGGFQIRSSLSPPGIMSKVHSILSNKV